MIEPVTATPFVAWLSAVQRCQMPARSCATQTRGHALWLGHILVARVCDLCAMTTDIRSISEGINRRGGVKTLGDLGLHHHILCD